MRPTNQSPLPPQLPADPAGHLPLPLLRQYVAGALSGAEEHRIEAHTLRCPRCADVLDGLTLSDAPTTDAALAALRGRLRQRVGQEAAPNRAAAWRAVAAVLLLLVLSTAAWLGLRRGKPAAGAPEVAAVRTPAAVRRIPEAESAPEPAAATIAENSSVATQAAEPVRPVEPAGRLRPARQLRVAARAARRPAAPAAVSGQAVVAAAGAADAAVAVAAEPAATPPASQAAEVAGLTQGVAAAKARVAAPESGSARMAALPTTTTIRPEPVGGYRALREYLHREAMFEPEPHARGLSGSVRLTFTVTAAGKVENIKVVRGIRADYDAEAIRMVCEGPAWQPGVSNGRRADKEVELSIAF